MIDRNPHIALNLCKQDVERYLVSHGWKQIEHPNQKLQVFAGPLDNEDSHTERLRQRPIRLALLLADNLSDTSLRIYQALQTIADTEGRSINTVVAEIERLLPAFSEMPSA